MATKNNNKKGFCKKRNLATGPNQTCDFFDNKNTRTKYKARCRNCTNYTQKNECNALNKSNKEKSS